MGDFSGNARVTNISRNKTIGMVRAYFYYSENCKYSRADIEIKKENYSYIELYLGPGEKKDVKFYAPENSNCFKISAKSFN